MTQRAARALGSIHQPHQFMLKPLAAVLLTAFGALAVQAQTSPFDTSIQPPAGYKNFQSPSLSGDGNTVVGGSNPIAGGAPQAIRWNGGVATVLPILSGSVNSMATGVSYDGSVMVGIAAGTGAYGFTNKAVRWSNGAVTELPGFTSTVQIFNDTVQSQAMGVSADGTVIVGSSGSAASSSTIGINGVVQPVTNPVPVQAVMWQNGAITGLGFLPGAVTSYANAVSADGLVIVGSSTTAAILGSNTPPAAPVAFVPGTSQAFRWVGGTMTGLGFLPNKPNSSATAVSANGAVVVGYGFTYATPTIQSSSEAFRWTNGTMTGLGFLPNFTNSNAKAVSADGNVVVGDSWNNSGIASTYLAYRWTSTGGMQSIHDWVGAQGITVPGFSGTYIASHASGVSADGNTVVGTYVGGTPQTGQTQQIWLARVVPGTPTPTPAPAAAAITPAPAAAITPAPEPTPAPAPAPTSGFIPDLQTFNSGLIETASQSVQVGVIVPSLALFGAHHRSLLDNGMVRKNDNGTCAWATADAARDNQTGTKMSLIEAGVCKDIGALRIGAGVGHNQADQSWANGGSAKFNGEHLVLEAAQQFANGIEGSVLGYYGNFNTELNRHYLNGINIDSSTAKPKAASYALRARAEWKDAVKQSNVSVSPYAAYTYTQTKLDGYTETGGGFPAQFDAATFKSNDLRLGANLKTSINPATDVKVGVELAHRFEKNTTGVNGKVIGLYDFSLAGEKVKQDWARVLIDVDYRITDDVVLTAGANAATKGGDASWGVTTGLRIRF